MEQKHCYRCKQTKNLDSFGKNSNKRLGVSTYCAACQATYSKTYYKENPEGILSSASKYQKTIKGHFNILKCAAKARNIALSISYDEYQEIVASTCHYCGGALPSKGGGLDRMDSNIGYKKGNVVACCKACNREKGNGLTEQEYSLIWAIRKGKIKNPMI